MIIHDGADIQCDGLRCSATIKNHYWGKVKAEDWFHGRNGESFCPKHIPEWVAAWRAKKAGK